MNAPTTKRVFDVVPYVAKRRTAEVIQLRARGEWATFYVDDPGHVGPGYFVLAIESSYGGYAHAWSHPGGDFKLFLADCNESYVMGKMVGDDRVLDVTETVRVLRRVVEGCKLSDGARLQEQVLLDDLEQADGNAEDALVAFHTYCESTRAIEAPWEYARTAPGRRASEFAALYELFWEPFVTELLVAAPRSA